MVSLRRPIGDGGGRGGRAPTKPSSGPALIKRVSNDNEGGSTSDADSVLPGRLLARRLSTIPSLCSLSSCSACNFICSGVCVRLRISLLLPLPAD